jgi:hypothetical protein
VLYTPAHAGGVSVFTAALAPATSTVQVAAAGVYRVSFAVSGAVGDEDIELRLHVNGAEVACATDRRDAGAGVANQAARSWWTGWCSWVAATSWTRA